MAEQKELRRMNRTELIEIIYALQQQELELRRENKELSERLEDRAIRLESAGSIAEAALSLNHIFEEAQKAADQYLMSVEAAREPEAQEDAELIISDAQAKAEQIIEAAKAEAEEIGGKSQRAMKAERDKFLLEIEKLLDENPELAAALRERARREDDG